MAGANPASLRTLAGIINDLVCDHAPVATQVGLDADAEGARLVLVDRSPLVLELMKQLSSNHGQGAAIDVVVNNVGGAIWMRP